MTYSAYEYSMQEGDPVLRFVFAVGNVEYRRTTEPHIVSDSNGAFLPSPIRISDINVTDELAKSPLKIQLPRDDEFAQLFTGGVPEQITSVTVYRGHLSDAAMEFVVYWKGRVAGVLAEGDMVRIDCENIFTSMRRPGLRARYQKNCRHALYQRGCNLNAYDFAVMAVATEVDGRTVTFADAVFNSNTLDGDFNGGMLETADGYLRFITSHEGDRVTLMSPIPSLTEEVGGSDGQAQVLLYPGCNHTLSDCVNKFDNRNNYGGFQWIPAKNPFKNNVSGSIV